MRLTRRAAKTAAMALAAALVLAACGGTSDDTDDTPADEAEEAGDDTEDTVEEEDAEVEEPEEVAEGVTEVPIWIAFTDSRLDWARDVAADFNDQVEGVQVTIQGYENYEALLDAALLAVDQGNPPAVVQYFEAATTEAQDAVAASGEPLFKNMEETLAGRDEVLGIPVIIDDIVDAARNYYTLDGQLTSMPWNTSSAIMFTNQDILDAAGIEEIPTTWQELEAACEVLMASDAAPSDCVTWPNHAWFTEQTIAQQGEVLANNDNGRSGRADEVNVDSDAMVDWMTYWKDMQGQGHYVYTGVQRDWDGTYNAFASQQVAFLVYSSSDTTLLTNEGVEGGYEVVASFMPRNADRTDGGGNIIGGATLWLVDGLEPDVEEAGLAFLNFLNNPENAADWHRVTGYIPITNASIDLLEAEGWFEENPNSAVAGEQLEAAPSTPATAGVLMGNFVAIRDVMTGAIEDVLVNDLDPAERMAEAQTEAQRLLDDYNALFGG